MPTLPSHPQEPQQVECSVCHKEIPLSAALTAEGVDYVGHFCGIECYDRFTSQQQNAGSPPREQH